MEIVVGALNVSIIFFLALWVQRKYASQTALLYWVAFTIKVLSTISLGLIYKFHYSVGDTWTFFDQASQLSTLARTDFLGYLKVFFSSYDPSTIEHILYIHDRSSIFIKLISFFCLVSNNSYWLCATYFALISFFSTWFLYKQIVVLLVDSTKAATLALFFFPSIAFWSSGLVKESLALSGIYFITAIFLKFARKAKISLIERLLAIFSLIIAWWLKYYWTALFLAVLFTSLTIILIERRKLLSRAQFVVGWSFLFILVCLITSLTHPNFYLERFLQVLVSNHDQYIAASHPQNVISYYRFQPTWWSVFLNSPWALFSGLFRPFFWETSNVLSFLSSIENLFLVLLVISFFAKESHRFNQSDAYITFLLPILTYCVFLCAFLAISTPNFGTLSRYRVGFMPFFIFALAYRNPLFDYLMSRLVKK